MPKVHLTFQLTYRWIRGFNEYDNRQASGYPDRARVRLLPSQAAPRRLPHAAGSIERVRNITADHPTVSEPTPLSPLPMKTVSS
jgi:hypothetical protein